MWADVKLMGALNAENREQRDASGKKTWDFTGERVHPRNKTAERASGWLKIQLAVTILHQYREKLCLQSNLSIIYSAQRHKLPDGAGCQTGTEMPV
jgi:hypothetical protein